MREIERDGDEVTVRATVVELRLIVGALNESLNGAYALPEDEWEPLVGAPPERAASVLRSLVAMFE